MGIQLVRSPKRKPLSQIIANLGLTSNLKLCLDAGDAASYDPDVQTNKWMDTSGNGFDFYLGAGTGSDSADPAINGSPGGLSGAEYFSFDGGDYFTYDSANETWMDNMHKESTTTNIMSWRYHVATPDGASQRLLGTRGALLSSNIGISYLATDADSSAAVADRMVINALKGSAVTWFSYTSSPDLTAGWMFEFWRFTSDDVYTTHYINRNGTVIADDVAVLQFGTGTTLPATYTMQIGAGGNNIDPLLSGSRLAMMAAWDSASLSPSEIQSLFNATRGRFGV